MLFLVILFAIYANSTAFLWILYLVEKDDIAEFYFDNGSQSTTDGASYVHKILDSSQPAKQSQRPVSIHQPDEINLFLFTEKTIDPGYRTGSLNDFQGPVTLLEGLHSRIFRPPTYSLF